MLRAVLEIEIHEEWRISVSTALLDKVQGSETLVVVGHKEVVMKMVQESGVVIVTDVPFAAFSSHLSDVPLTRAARDAAFTEKGMDRMGEVTPFGCHS